MASMISFLVELSLRQLFFFAAGNCEEDCILLFLYIFFFADLVALLAAYFDQIPPDLRLLLLVT